MKTQGTSARKITRSFSFFSCCSVLRPLIYSLPQERTCHHGHLFSSSWLPPSMRTPYLKPSAVRQKSLHSTFCKGSCFGGLGTNIEAKFLVLPTRPFIPLYVMFYMASYLCRWLTNDICQDQSLDKLLLGETIQIDDYKCLQSVPVPWAASSCTFTHRGASMWRSFPKICVILK